MGISVGVEVLVMVGVAGVGIGVQVRGRDYTRPSCRMQTTVCSTGWLTSFSSLSWKSRREVELERDLREG
jgi:hypothetical protein